MANESEKIVRTNILLQKCPQGRKKNILLYELFLFEIVIVHYQILKKSCTANTKFISVVCFITNEYLIFCLTLESVLSEGGFSNILK